MTTELNQGEVIKELFRENQDFFDNKERYVGKLFYSFELEENVLLLSIEKIVKQNLLYTKHGPPTYRTSLVFILLAKEKITEYTFCLSWREHFSLVEETNQE